MEDSISKFCCSYFFAVKNNNFKITDVVDFISNIEYRFDRILREFKEKLQDRDPLIMFQFNIFGEEGYSNWLGVCNIFGEEGYSNWLGVCNIFGEEVEMLEFENIDCEYCLLKEIVRKEFEYDENLVIVNIN